MRALDRDRECPTVEFQMACTPLRLSGILASMLTACGTPSMPATEAPPAVLAQPEPVVVPTPQAPIRAPAPAPIEAPVAGPLRWRDYACHVTGPWEPGPPLAALEAPADAESSDVLGWYAEGRVGRLFLWRARGALMGELRWLRREGGAWVESGSGARRWPRHFDAESEDTLVVAAPRFAILAHRGGADNRFLAGVWLVSDAAPPRAIRLGHGASIGGAIVTDTGEVHLHLSEGFRYTAEQIAIHFAADGREVARRTVVVEDGQDTRSLGASADGLVEAVDGGSRLHGYDASSSPTPLSLAPRLIDPYQQLDSGVEPCTDEAGLRFAHYGLGMGFAMTESMLVTYEVLGTGTCVRAMNVPLYGPQGALDCERCDVVLEARSGALVGHALSSDGRTRGVRCATAPGVSDVPPMDRVQAQSSATVTPAAE